MKSLKLRDLVTALGFDPSFNKLFKFVHPKDFVGHPEWAMDLVEATSESSDDNSEYVNESSSYSCDSLK